MSLRYSLVSRRSERLTDEVLLLRGKNSNLPSGATRKSKPITPPLSAVLAINLIMSKTGVFSYSSLVYVVSVFSIKGQLESQPPMSNRQCRWLIDCQCQ